MAKEDPLRAHPGRDGRPRVETTFDEVAALVGGPPGPTYRHQAWWADETPGAGSRHVRAAGWLGAGYRVEAFDLVGRRVRFARDGVPR